MIHISQSRVQVLLMQQLKHNTSLVLKHDTHLHMSVKIQMKLYIQLNISIKAVEKQISKALSGLKEYLIQRDLFPLLVLAVTCLSL